MYICKTATESELYRNLHFPWQSQDISQN